VFLYYTNNHDISIFPIAKLGLYFHNKTDTLKYLTTGPEIGLSHGVHRARFAAQSSDKKPGAM